MTAECPHLRLDIRTESASVREVFAITLVVACEVCVQSLAFDEHILLAGNRTLIGILVRDEGSVQPAQGLMWAVPRIIPTPDATGIDFADTTADRKLSPELHRALETFVNSYRN